MFRKALTTAIIFLAAAVIDPLAVVTAQRDQAIQQRNAFREERNAFRRVCRAHGWDTDDAPTWLAEVLADGSLRWEWDRVFAHRREHGEEIEED